MKTSLLEDPAVKTGTFRAGKALALLGLSVAVLAGCGTEDGGSDGEPAGATDEDTAVHEDLHEANSTVADALVDYPDVTQVVLSDAATESALIYGSLEVPFSPSEATADFSRTVDIDGGDYTIEAESVATELVWQIDQDGEISQVTE